MSVTFLKKGKAAASAIEKSDAQAELNKNQGARRFWMKSDTDTCLTFVDGDLNDEGIIDMPIFEEHSTDATGSWKDFVCIADEEPCPICEHPATIKGHKPSLVGALTVIDHSTWEGQKDEHKNKRKLLIIKRGTMKMLQKIATKRGGLAGCSFDVCRSDSDMAPKVGDLYDFIEKVTPAAMKKKWGDEAVPLNYEEEIIPLDAEQLRVLGFGGASPVGSADKTSSSAYDEDL